MDWAGGALTLKNWTALTRYCEDDLLFATSGQMERPGVPRQSLLPVEREAAWPSWPARSAACTRIPAIDCPMPDEAPVINTFFALEVQVRSSERSGSIKTV